MLIFTWEIEMLNLVRRMRTMEFRAITFFSLLSLFFPAFAYALGNLENPAAGSTESGISIVSGWHCSASNIDIYIDDIHMGVAKVGTVRLDTKDVCGHTNAGFSFLINYNSLTAGSHEIKAYADGSLFETQQFNSVSSSGVEPFVAGLSKSIVVPNFPTAGTSAIMQWSTSKQGFTVTNIENGNTSLDGRYKLDRLVLQFLSGKLTDTDAASSYSASGTMAIVNGNSMEVSVALQASGVSKSIINDSISFTDHGYYLQDLSDNDGNMMVISRGSELILSYSGYNADGDPSQITMYWVRTGQ